MSSPSVGPKRFDVMPAAILQRAMLSALPADATYAWQQAGILPVSDGRLVVMDAASYARPRHIQSEGKILPWPTDTAEVWFQVICDRTGKVLRVVGALVSLPGTDLSAIAGDLAKTEACSMPIDSATMMIADVQRLKTHWKGAGPHCRANLGGSTKDPQRRMAQEQAAALLSRAGFHVSPKEENGYLQFNVEQLQSDAQIERAESLLQASGLDLRLNVWETETGADLSDRLIQDRITQLANDAGQTYLFASSTGFGDGIYYWDALTWRGSLVGYLCDFMPPDDEADGNQASPPVQSAPQPALQPPAIAKPPILAGQIATFYRNRQFLLVKVQQPVAGGFVVQLVNGSTGTVSLSELIPNPGHPVFQMGDQVLAHWNNGFMFPGTITAISPQGYTIAWHDGDQQLVVPLGTLTFLYWAREAAAASGSAE